MKVWMVRVSGWMSCAMLSLIVQALAEVHGYGPSAVIGVGMAAAYILGSVYANVERHEKGR